MPGTHPMSGTALVSGRPGGVGEGEGPELNHLDPEMTESFRSED